MLAEASDIDPLPILNELRELESRKPLTVLPSVYKNLCYERITGLINSWKEQIDIHKVLKSNSIEYNNRIILNDTEQLLHAKNKRNPDSAQHYL